MDRDFRIIFVHGYTASSKENWYPNISKELTNSGIDFVIPDLPGGEHPHAKNWLETIHKTVLETKKPLVFVGHSLGTRAILLYLEKYKTNVKAVFLIAAFANRLENAQKYDKDAYPDFFEHLIAIDEIKSLSEKFVVIHSMDDELDYEQGEKIADQLGAKLVTLEGRGHMSDPDNAPIIFEILKSELGF